MSLLFDGRIRITDSAGVPVNGGKARIYNANTTTLTTVYSDATLSTPLPNPVVALSDGWCPQIFAAEGTTVDIDKLTSTGIIIKSYEDVTFVGSSAGTFTRDFTTSRAQIRGAGGTTYYEAGDPTGDDTGGVLSLGGWNGTQATSATINAATTNTTGTFTENSKKLPGVVVTSTTFSAQATVDVALTQTPFTGVMAWDIQFIDLDHAGGALSVRFATDTVPSFITAANYAWANSVDGVAASNTAQTSAQIVSGSGSGASMHLRINWNPTATTYLASGYYSRGNSTQSISAAYGSASAVVPSYIRFFPAAGTMSGRLRVIPVRGFGES